MQFNGEGIQHVALLTQDLTATIDSLAMAGVPLMAAVPMLPTARRPSPLARHSCDRPGPCRGGPISSEATLGPVFHGWHAGARIVASLDGPPASMPVGRPNLGQPPVDRTRPRSSTSDGVRSTREEEPCEASG